MKLPSTLTLLVSLLLFINSSAQTTLDKTDTIVAIFKTVIRADEKEKIIVQTDRKLYITGEKIWFRAFVVNAATHKITCTSKNLFTDLVDDHDSVIATLVLNNQELNTTGAFTLADSLKTGFYWLRSYTAKILATDTAGIFVQPIYILNKGLQDAAYYNRQYTNTANKNIGNPVIHFFPERLTNIPNIISTGVLQINDANNNPLTASGEIINNNDSVITSFKTNHFGLARVTFLNEAGQKYHAIFHTGSRDIKYTIPSTGKSTTQLSVANQNEQTIKAFVTLEEDLPFNFRTTILGINGDSLCYAAVGSGTYGITIPLNNFPGGINTLLLFDEQQHLLAERKIFISKDNYQLSIKANKKNYAARENAMLDIKVTGINGKPVTTALNIAVEDAWFAQLSDSLAINDPPPNDAFYLNNWLNLYHTKYAPADIDLLMVTAKPGYKSSAPEKTNELQNDDSNEQLLNLIGKITDRKNAPQQDRVITVMSKNSNSFFVDVDTTKQDGSFKIALPQIDSLTLSIQVSDKHNIVRTDDNIIIDTFSFPSFATPVSLKQPFLASNINTVSLLRKYRVDTAITFQGKGWLKPVVVTTIKKELPNYDESRRINSISQILTSDRFRYGGYNAVGYAVLTVPGVTMYNGDLTIFGPGVDFQGNIGRPLLVVDGVAMGSASLGYLNNLSPADIDFIEVLRGAEAGIYGVRGGNGVISVNTKHGSDKIDYSKTNFKIFSPLTYHKSPPFYVPDYSNATIKNNKSPDPRTTIYWNGNIITDAKGEATVNFYTSDNATNYSVTVTGITAKGDLIYKRIFISRN
jgi:TonB-dependent SusC/RagA subfamily outer membrane receptor